MIISDYIKRITLESWINNNHLFSIFIDFQKPYLYVVVELISETELIIEDKHIEKHPKILFEWKVTKSGNVQAK